MPVKRKKSDLPFIEHLEELRRRFLWLLSVLFFFTIIYFLLFDRLSLFKIILYPLEKINQKLYFYHIAEPFLARVKLSFIFSLVTSAPFILYHLFAFLIPALKRKEKSLGLIFTFLIMVLFSTGALFAYYYILPFSINFLLKFAPQQVKPLLRLNEYISLCITFVFGTGLIFQMPLVIIFLTKLDIIDYKFLLRYTGEAIIIIFIISALITPPDVYSQVLLGLPLILLYLISIALSYALQNKR
ncbi:MAG: twin-arginine translocase subunit TatC [Spirochaetes bacterium]|nr:twin-arginine translocase subunit TatC [Spirochaetota bacterium]